MIFYELAFRYEKSSEAVTMDDPKILGPFWFESGPKATEAMDLALMPQNCFKVFFSTKWPWCLYLIALKCVPFIITYSRLITWNIFACVLIRGVFLGFLWDTLYITSDDNPTLHHLITACNPFPISNIERHYSKLRTKS